MKREKGGRNCVGQPNTVIGLKEGGAAIGEGLGGHGKDHGLAVALADAGGRFRVIRKMNLLATLWGKPISHDRIEIGFGGTVVERFRRCLGGPAQVHRNEWP